MQPVVKTLRSLLNVNPSAPSQVDIIYRSILRNDFFGQGWGQISTVEKLLKFQRIMSDREKCNLLVDKAHPVHVEDVRHYPTWTLIKGHLKSPLANQIPGCLPKNCETANFQFCIPNIWMSEDRPVSIHMSGTGDHYFWRRRVLLARPLLRKGIASLLMENPFYGSRKPKNQRRSNLNHVDNIFLMGGGLILESIAILRWLEKEGYGPFCLTGISMGGHMASLAATNWPKPIAVVPCLSWSSASGVFTRGVMSKVVNWDKLVEQFNTEPEYKKRIEKRLCNFPMVNSRLYTSHAQADSFRYSLSGGWDEAYKREIEQRRERVRQKYVFKVMDKMGLVKAIAYLNQILAPKNKAVTLIPGKDDKDVDLITYLENLEPSFEAVDFMRRLMDHFTHLSNFEIPVDPELAIVITARNDAYVPRQGVLDIRDIWPGSKLRYVDAGHVVAYIKHQGDFKDAIIDAIDLYRSKYNLDGSPKPTPDSPTNSLKNFQGNYFRM